MTTEEIKKKVETAIESIRPRLQMDGGDVKLVDIVDGVVKVELEGACRGCPMSQLTLQMGIERTIKKEVPEIKSVENIHASVPSAMMERFRQMYSGYPDEAEEDEKKEDNVN